MARSRSRRRVTVTPKSVGAIARRTTSAFYDPDTGRSTGSTARAPTRGRPAARTRSGPRPSAVAVRSTSIGVSDTDRRRRLPKDGRHLVVAPTLDPTRTPFGFTGVSPLPTIATRAVDHARRRWHRRARQPASRDTAAPDRLRGRRRRPARRTDPRRRRTSTHRRWLRRRSRTPDSVTGALDDRPVDAASGLLQPGEVSLAEPVALGNDDWSLVWGARLPDPDGRRAWSHRSSPTPTGPSNATAPCASSASSSPSDDAAGRCRALGDAVLGGELAGHRPGGRHVARYLTGPARGVRPGRGRVRRRPEPGVVDGWIDRQQLRLTELTPVGSVAEVVELQRDAQLGALEHRHDVLEVIALLARDTRTVSPWVWLWTPLGPSDLISLLISLALSPEIPTLIVATCRTVFWVASCTSPYSTPTERDAALDELLLEHGPERVESILARRVHRDDELVQLDRRVGVLEVEPVGDLPCGLVDRVANFLAVDFGDDIETGHAARLSTVSPATSAPAPRPIGAGTQGRCGKSGGGRYHAGSTRPLRDRVDTDWVGARVAKGNGL